MTVVKTLEYNVFFILTKRESGKVSRLTAQCAASRSWSVSVLGGTVFASLTVPAQACKPCLELKVPGVRGRAREGCFWVFLLMFCMWVIFGFLLAFFENIVENLSRK